MVHSQLPAVPERSVARPENDRRRERLAGLLDEARAKVDGALDAVVGELSPLLWQVARSQGLDRAASEDVVQTTWLSLLRSLDDIRTPDALIGWLVTVTRREAGRVRDAGRRQQPVDESMFVSLRDTDSGPDEQFVDNERRRALWAAVNRLPA